MSLRNPGLTADPLFVGATRPPMRWGVTYTALLVNLVFTIVENCGNTLILRCGGSEHGGTSQFAAKLIGEREIVRVQRSRTREGPAFFSARGATQSRQSSEQQLLEPAVLASELEQLPDLCGYLKLTSTTAWRRVKLAFPPSRQ